MSRESRRRPSLESLEDRRLPTSLGVPWADRGHLAIRFESASVGRVVGESMPTRTRPHDVQHVLRSRPALGDLSVNHLDRHNAQAVAHTGNHAADATRSMPRPFAFTHARPMTRGLNLDARTGGSVAAFRARGHAHTGGTIHAAYVPGPVDTSQIPVGGPVGAPPPSPTPVASGASPNYLTLSQPIANPVLN